LTGALIGAALLHISRDMSSAVRQDLRCNADRGDLPMSTTETALRASLQEMLDIYWGDGDGILPVPSCIRRAQAALANPPTYWSPLASEHGPQIQPPGTVKV
jgi:hypothetical protein